MEPWSPFEANRVLQEVIKRSTEDPDFRSLALRNPRAAIAIVTPQPLPAGFTVRFVENAGASRTFVLPDPLPLTDNLSDADLEQVAGGLFDRCNTTCNTTCANAGSGVSA
jgi:hypothetical protein